MVDLRPRAIVRVVCASKRGFTFLEIMVALAIVSGVLVTVITTVNLHLSYVERAKDEFEATLLAREKIEEIRLGIEQEISSGDFGKGGRFKWEYDASARNAGPEGVNVAEVAVRWGADRKDATREVRLKFFEAL